MIKKFIRQLFSAIGYEIHKKGCVRTNLSQVLHQIKKVGFAPNTVIDVGVGYGTYDLYEAYPDASFLLVEPLQEFSNILETISKKFKATYIIAAAGSRAGTVNINVHSDLEGSSIYKETDGPYVDGVQRQVPLVRIDDICETKRLSGSYLIKVDTQGSEVDVVNGCQRILGETEVIILEVSFFKFFKNGMEFLEVISHMKNLGFVVYDICGQKYRPLDGALAQVDVVFVKENGIFRSSHSFATKDQRGLKNKVV